ncbi:MAG TPA: AraC family transcriptional regulator [Candidatus Acetatifactor stercoripullorum]|uniref:AraC family transcriptional regulator n=1 Tax=Candidatus Acetatifactor stercoripullorum TaxID=2838414 RepID=A0A9D1R6R0_9FIRM|nr:AraC family transcriptional regulator [Candidatus Acetatifactor stercoripullorum]
MTEELLQELKKITPEEQKILSGTQEIEKSLYMSSEADVIDAKKLLEAGKMIQVRTHTRFVHFPKHTHNYIEVIYMCSGSTRHIVNGEEVILRQGELLFLNQKVTQEIYPAGENDIAVNFIILPEFFDYGLKMMETEENLLRDFIIDCLRGENGTNGYLHFKVADILPVQNLVENLIWTIMHRQPNKRSINQATMGLLFLQLMNCMDKLETDEGSGRQKLIITVLSYIESHYRDGELSELAESLHYDVYWLSKEIKKRTGKTYTELLQAKRLGQAAYLLGTTSMSVMEVALAVGYDNISYFHRIFQKKYGCTPRAYRLSASLPRQKER